MEYKSSGLSDHPLEKVISQIESQQPELASALKGDEKKKRQVIEKILKRESAQDINLEQNLKQNLSQPPGSPNLFEKKIKDIDESLSTRGNNKKQIELFHQLKEIKSKDVTRILLEKLISSLTLSYLSNIQEDKQIIVGENITEQFLKKIEGIKVSEEMLNKFRGLEKQEIPNKSVELKEEMASSADEKTLNEFVKEKSIKAVDSPTLAKTKQVEQLVTQSRNSITLHSSPERNLELSGQELKEIQTSGLGESIKEQFAKEIEGLKVSEEMLNKFRVMEKPEVLPKSAQSGEKMVNEAVDERKISKFAKVEKSFKTGFLKEGIEEKVSSQLTSLNLVDKFSIEYLVQKWFKTNKNPLMGNTDYRLQTTDHRLQTTEYKITQSPNDLMMVSNTFNIYLNSKYSKEKEDNMQLLEEKINKILTAQAKRYGISV